MKTILFQGDSITDCGRYRKATDEKQNTVCLFKDGKLLKRITALGDGYPSMVSTELEAEKNGEYRFINRGVSGDRIPDVYARIVRDIISLKPDCMSLLVGVNDVWHGMDFGSNNGTGTARFEKVYNILLEELKEELPELKIIIMGPFVIEGTATKNRPEQPNRYAEFRNAVAEMAVIEKQLAEKHGCAYIDLQSAFDEAVKSVPATTLSGDGVHPTKKGHELIKEKWLSAFSEFEV